MLAVVPFVGSRCARLGFAFVLLSTTAGAERSRVVLMRPAEPEGVVAEVTNRIQGELTASGFDVVIAPAPTDVDFPTPATLSKTEPGVVATFAIVSVGGGQAAIDVWLADRITAKTSIRRLEGGTATGAGAKVLAIRAVELLRASLLEAVVPPSGPVDSTRTPVPADVNRFVETRSGAFISDRSWPGTASFEAGVGALDGFGGLGPSLSPVLRFAYAVRPDVFARATLSGPTLAREIQTTTGSASTRQEFGLLEIAYALRLGRHAALRGSGGAGVYHLSVQGSALAPHVGGSPQLWSAVLDAGVGGALRTGAHSAIAVDLHALFTQRQAFVDLADGVARYSGRPILFVTLGVWTGF